MKYFERFKNLYSKIFIPVQGTHELLKNPVTNQASAPACMSVPHFYCTRCNRNEIDCKLNGCERAPCPMDLIANKPWVQEVKKDKLK